LHRFKFTMLLNALIWSALAGNIAAGPVLHNGDIVLQASKSGMSDSIQRATRSPYTHVGVVEVSPKGVYVIEAISPVSRTPFEKWRAKGRDGHLTVMRAHLPPHALDAVVSAARTQLGKPYDTRYAWDDERVYCSELVVKAFERGAHLELGKRVRLDALKLSDAERALAATMGVQLSQEVVPPGSFADEPHLQRVYSDMP